MSLLSLNHRVRQGIKQALYFFADSSFWSRYFHCFGDRNSSYRDFQPLFPIFWSSCLPRLVLARLPQLPVFCFSPPRFSLSLLPSLLPTPTCSLFSHSLPFISFQLFLVFSFPSLPSAVGSCLSTLSTVLNLKWSKLCSACCAALGAAKTLQTKQSRWEGAEFLLCKSQQHSQEYIFTILYAVLFPQLEYVTFLLEISEHKEFLY